MISWLLGMYLFSGLCVYLYAVVKSYEVLGFYSWEITENYIGICSYPKWLLGWAYWIKQKVKK